MKEKRKKKRSICWLQKHVQAYTMHTFVCEYSYALYVNGAEAMFFLRTLSSIPNTLENRNRMVQFRFGFWIYNRSVWKNCVFTWCVLFLLIFFFLLFFNSCLLKSCDVFGDLWYVICFGNLNYPLNIRTCSIGFRHLFEVNRIFFGFINLCFLEMRLNTLLNE